MTCIHASVAAAAACLHQTSNIKGDQIHSTGLFFRLGEIACKKNHLCLEAQAINNTE